MVKIRLSRVGRRHSAFYRVVVADARRARDGKFIEILGRYQPVMKDNQITVDAERALHWLHNGAQPTDTVRSILRKEGIMKRFHEEKVAERKKAQGEKAAAS